MMAGRTSSVRNVNLRILREGPTHNHLISPLTPYLAAVGPYEAVTIRMPYEHRRLLRDLNALRYGADAARGPNAGGMSRAERNIIADGIGEIFAAIPGLTSELATDPRRDAGLTHLRMTFSAAELSLVPFELATAPRGFPGERFPLCVQSTAPVVITRSIPTAGGDRCSWVRPPRILFVIAQPPGLSPVPYESHLLALSQALRPWVGAGSELASNDDVVAALNQHLRVLPNATLASIEAACAAENFSHIHVLAHSELVEDGGQTHFALALHDGHGGKELVSAERLQATLRLPTARNAGDHQLARPLVVTLATCDSGLAPQVIFPTMSLAHALHAAGVPLVVGSLFPLTFRGSTVMTQKLYGGLLAGRDPRWCLYDMRHALFRMTESTHDWASVVAYASLPEDIESQTESLAFMASRSSINVAFRHGNRSWRRALEDRAFMNQLTKIDEGIARRCAELPTTDKFLLEGLGVLASAEKRRAELFWLASQSVANGEYKRQLVEDSKRRLRRALDRYVEASRTPRWRLVQTTTVPDFHWVLSQVLCLEFVLGMEGGGSLTNQETWAMARVDAENYLSMPSSPEDGGGVKSGSAAMWAHSSLMELHLLKHAESEQEGPEQRHADQAMDHLRRHIELARAAGELGLTHSTRDQLRRYEAWWFHREFCGADALEKAHVRRALELSRTLLAQWGALEGY